MAVFDTGVDYNHPDLNPNMWVNPGETPGNGIDDDGNGFVDDVHGIDAISMTGDPMERLRGLPVGKEYPISITFNIPNNDSDENP